MKPSRREFLKTSALGSAGLSLGIARFGRALPKKPKQLRILILGGTAFLGPHQIKYALERGHKVSTFTRGKTEPTVNREVFKQVESLIGDRNDNLNALKGRIPAVGETHHGDSEG